MARKRGVIELLVIQLDECFLGGAWHGESLLPNLKKLDVGQALYESTEGLSAWKVALHCAYWKYRARRKIDQARGLAAGRFDRSPADWPSLPGLPSAEGWKADLAILEGHHEALRAAIAGLPVSMIAAEYDAEGHSYHRLIAGAAAHDVYHAAHIRNIGIPGLT
jgi:hypothetical protein